LPRTLPPKKGWGTSPEVVAERVCALTLFVDAVDRNPFLSADALWLHFLTPGGDMDKPDGALSPETSVGERRWRDARANLYGVGRDRMRDDATLHVALATLDTSDAQIKSLLTGCEALARAMDYWRSRLPRTATVVGLADSGFFLDWKQNGTSAHSYDEDLRWGFEHMRYDVDCDAGADCAFAEHALARVRTPVFLLQTTYDSWQLQWELGLTKPVDYAALNAYGRELEDKLRAAGARAGGFVERCYHHCTTRDLWTTTPTIDGVAAGDAFTAFYRAVAAGAPTPPLLWQDGALPCAGCACPGGMVKP